MKNIGQLANNRQLTTKDIRILKDKEVKGDEGNYEYMSKRPQSEESARIELEVDMARERERERRQMDMFDDPDMNWSGHR